MLAIRLQCYTLIVGVFLCILITSQAWSDAGTGPRAAGLGLTTDGDLRISAGDRCPVCGMFPAKRPKGAAAMVLKYGRTFYFCGNGCLLRTWHHIDTHLGVFKETVDRMVVRDYFSGAAVDARKGWWVAGSDVTGPMGRALVVLDSKSAVDAFKSRHGGRQVFQLEQLDDQLFKAIFSKK